MTTLKLETEYCGTHEFEVDRKVLCFECEEEAEYIDMPEGYYLCEKCYKKSIDKKEMR